MANPSVKICAMIVGQWMFAVFMAIVTFCLSFYGVIFFGLKLQQFFMDLGLQIGWLVATSMIVIPALVAPYVGAITAPNSQLKIASIVFPSSFFLIMNIVLSPAKGGRQGSYLQNFLEIGAGCLIAAFCLYVRRKRQLSKRIAKENVS